MTRRATPPGSLLRIPLVRHLLEDRTIRLEPRAVDAEWWYSGSLPVKLPGFNPFRNRVFYARESRFAQWLRQPAKPARALNERDLLVPEVLMAVHDHLHAWAWQLMAGLVPTRASGERPVTARTLEDAVFCHLVSEAAATVGLDYWYLSTVNLNEVCDLGTQQGPLTVMFHERHLDEYRRFNRRLDVHRPEHFEEIVRFYCTGVYEGFDLADVKRSPRLLAWLGHEVTYSGFQREYARQWFASRSRERVPLEGRLRAPVDCSAGWKRELSREVGRRLWRKVTEDRLETAAHAFSPRAWRASHDRLLDFRFVNLNALADPPEAWPAIEPASFPYLVHQTLARKRFSRFERRLLKLVPALIATGDAVLVDRVFGSCPDVPAAGREERDLMFVA